MKNGVLFWRCFLVVLAVVEVGVRTAARGVPAEREPRGGGKADGALVFHLPGQTSLSIRGDDR